MQKELNGFDFHAFGRELKRNRIERGLSQKDLGLLVDRTQRSIMNFENKGQMPTLDVFYKLVTFLGISVDALFYPDFNCEKSEARQKLDFFLKEMDEKDISIMIGTAKAIMEAKNMDE